MASPERGTKRQCLNCSTKFYDLNRDPILCPSCGKEFVIQVAGAPAAVAEKPAEEAKTDIVEKDVAAEEAGAEVVSLNDVEDDDDDDTDENIPDVDDVEVDDELSGDQQDVFLEEDDDEGDVIGVAVPTDDDDT